MIEYLSITSFDLRVVSSVCWDEVKEVSDKKIGAEGRVKMIAGGSGPLIGD